MAQVKSCGALTREQFKCGSLQARRTDRTQDERIRRILSIPTAMSHSSWPQSVNDAPVAVNIQ